MVTNKKSNLLTLATKFHQTKTISVCTHLIWTIQMLTKGTGVFHNWIKILQGNRLVETPERTSRWRRAVSLAKNKYRKKLRMSKDDFVRLSIEVGWNRSTNLQFRIQELFLRQNGYQTACTWILIYGSESGKIRQFLKIVRIHADTGLFVNITGDEIFSNCPATDSLTSDVNTFRCAAINVIGKNLRNIRPTFWFLRVLCGVKFNKLNVHRFDALFSAFFKRCVPVRPSLFHLAPV